MDVRHGLQPEGQRGRFAVVAITDVLLDKGGQPGFQFSRIAALPEQDVAVRLAPTPSVERQIRKRLMHAERRENVESEVRIGRQVRHDAGYFEMKGALRVHDLPHGVLVAEVLPGDGLGQHDLVVAAQRGPGIAFQKRDVEDVEDRSVRQVERTFVESPVAVLDHPGVHGRVETHHVFHFGEVFAHLPGRGRHDFGGPDGRAALPFLGDHAVDAVRLVVKPVIAQLVADIEQNEQAAGDAERQAHGIDEGVALPAAHVAQGHCDVVPEHGASMSGCSSREIAVRSASRHPYSPLFGCIKT